MTNACCTHNWSWEHPADDAWSEPTNHGIWIHDVLVETDTSWMRAITRRLDSDTRLSIYQIYIYLWVVGPHSWLQTDNVQGLLGHAVGTQQTGGYKVQTTTAAAHPPPDHWLDDATVTRFLTSCAYDRCGVPTQQIVLKKLRLKTEEVICLSQAKWLDGYMMTGTKLMHGQSFLQCIVTSWNIHDQSNPQCIDTTC